MHRPIRIAVLECDTPPEKTNLKYDGYYGVFSKLLRRSAEALGQPEQLDPDSGLEISRWDVVTEQAYPSLENVDGIVLTGASKSDRFRVGSVAISSSYLPTPQSTTHSTTRHGS